MRLNYIDNEQFKQSLYVSEFILFLQKIIFGHKNIHCEYIPKKGKRNVFAINSFEDGLKQYSWAGKAFDDTQEVLNILSDQINSAVEENNELLMLQVALSILEWGQVYRGCIDWLVTHSQANQLIDAIISASKIIDGTSKISADEFSSNFDRHGQYRCNSGTTKIFSILSKKSIIYDGRVACALGMFVYDFLTENQIDYVPSELNFLMDAADRDISKYTSSAFTFASKKDQANALFNQAISNLKINLILQELVNNSQSSIFGLTDARQKMRAIEASMFMIGYRVNIERFEKTGNFLI